MYKKFILAKTLDKVMQFCCRYTNKLARIAYAVVTNGSEYVAN